MTASILIPTCHLRVLINRIGAFESKKLQQKMLDSVTGEAQWVDIPEVIENSGDKA